jgi:hypothetical protein
MTTTRMSARELAAAYANAKSPATKAELRTYCAARAKESDKARWAHLLSAIDAGDKARIAYHAAAGEAKREAAKALPKPDAKPAAKAPAKAPAKTAPKAPAKADPMATAAKALGVPADKLAAFVALLKA